MERLGDILNQVAEQTAEETAQVALPPIEGRIEYEGAVSDLEERDHIKSRM